MQKTARSSRYSKEICQQTNDQIQKCFINYINCNLICGLTRYCHVTHQLMLHCTWLVIGVRSESYCQYTGLLGGHLSDFPCREHGKMVQDSWYRVLGMLFSLTLVPDLMTMMSILRESYWCTVVNNAASNLGALANCKASKLLMLCWIACAHRM